MRISGKYKSDSTINFQELLRQSPFCQSTYTLNAASTGAWAGLFYSYI